MNEELNCPRCKSPISQNSNYCSKCGFELNKKESIVSTKSYISAYFVAILLPPLGLWPAYKYYKYGGEKGKTTAFVLIGLTAASLIINIWIAKIMLNRINGYVDKQLNLYQNFTY